MARAAGKKPARRKGATSRRPAGRQGASGLAWAIGGLMAAAFVAFLWYLWQVREDARDTRPAVADGAEVVPPAGGAGPAPGGGKPAGGEERFEFYTLLPNQDVMPGSKPAPAQPEAAPAEAAYLLQAGSFRSEAEADKRRATILMLGMPVKVVKVGTTPEDTWFRVVVGPFKGKAAAEAARTTLKGSGVDALPPRRA